MQTKILMKNLKNEKKVSEQLCFQYHNLHLPLYEEMKEKLMKAVFMR